MILKNLDDINLDNFPVAIFGSGPAGITTALELEKKNIKCLLIEAGGENYSQTSQEFYKGKIIEIPYVQKKDDNLSKSKSYSNIFTFFYLGSVYFLRIIITLIRN